jgi:ribosome maturation factor RimP
MKGRCMSKSIIEAVEPLLSAVAAGQGVELYDLEYVKEGGDRILRLYIDKDGGVDLNDCERVSRAAEALLDEKDPIPAAYVLEVSSPGIERKLKKESHFARYVGAKVEIRLFSPLDGRKKFTGILNGLENGIVTLTDSTGNVCKLEWSKISSCRLIVF